VEALGKPRQTFGQECTFGP